ncbi:MAG: hypothetical protein ABW019_11165 [Chitinophagaceae bacterium]
MFKLTALRLSLLAGLLLPVLTQAQSNQINITGFTVKSQLPPDINDWVNIPGSVLLVAQKLPGTPSYNPGLVIQIRNGSGLVCGSSVNSPIALDNFTVRNFQAAQLTGYLGQCPPLQPGSYTICVQFFNEDKLPVSREVCKEFTVIGEPTACSPPRNITPVNGKVFLEKDLIMPVVFTWSPVMPFDRNGVTYQLTIWEVEEGQTDGQAAYNNLPVLEQDVQGQTRYVLRPGFLERRNARYVWKVIALNERGEPVCKTAQSELSVFTTQIAQKEASDPPPPSDCCNDSIKLVNNTVSLAPGDVLAIAQQFAISPVNIKKVTAEIISVEEEPIDTSCMKCNGKEDWAYQFISHNTASWNSSPALNGTPVNSGSYYPARMVEWNCNQQGNLQLNFKISLPGTATGCVRKGKICIRYGFTDSNCKTCERIICYSFETN